MIARAPRFWWRPPGLLAALLSPVARRVGRIAAARLAEPPSGAVAVPVVCVGNLVVGGAGKTPTVTALAALAADRAPAILVRGYGGSLTGPVRVDPARHGAAEVGDEALLAAAIAPTVAGRDRVAAARLAVEGGAGLILMDDGFQNPALARDVAILVVDAASGVGNGRCLPAGPLRAPVADQIARADAVLLVGTGAAGEAVAATAKAAGVAVLRARLAAVAPERFAGMRALAFAGIGRPEKFYETLEGCGAEVVERRSFADHHPFDEAEAEAILAAADHAGLVPVTTAKDHVRLIGGPARAALAARAEVLEVRLVPDDPAAFAALIARAAERAARRISRAP